MAESPNLPSATPYAFREGHHVDDDQLPWDCPDRDYDDDARKWDRPAISEDPWLTGEDTCSPW